MSGAGLGATCSASVGVGALQAMLICACACIAVNEFVAEGARVLMPALQTLTQLTTLDLGGDMGRV